MRLQFPRDHGAHPASRLEWWYATGWLQAGAGRGADAALWGFQVTFFRAATGLARGLPGRLAPRQLLLAHAAVTDITRQEHRHADRMARWSGEAHAGQRVFASPDDAHVRVHDWHLQRQGPVSGGVYRTRCSTGSFGLDLQMLCTQPLLLQGDQGFSRKGPDERQASFYTTETQLRVSGRLSLGERVVEGQGRAWMDHEWSNELLHPEAVGWDWVGMNLDDGMALTAFQLRRADGTAVWAGGSWRPPGGQGTSFKPSEVAFEGLEHWRSTASGARYPIAWRIRTTAGEWTVRALAPSQELDSRNTTGTTYWEGLAGLIDARSQQVGRGYLEMTGYAGRLSL